MPLHSHGNRLKEKLSEWHQPNEITRAAEAGAPLLRVIPLGGLGEIGKNMMVLESGENLLIIDVGLMFPTNDMHGIDIVIPDAHYVYERLDWVRGIILTHGHEDHIGGLPYLMEQGLDAPIYATALTRGLLEVKLREHKLLDDADLHTVTEDDVLGTWPLHRRVLPHLPQLPRQRRRLHQTPAGRVIHTSDYRFDPTPGRRQAHRNGEAPQRGAMKACCCSSPTAPTSNAKAHTPSERTVETMLERVFGQAEGRVLLATFASNLGRVQQIINVARRHGRRVGVVGRSMVNNVKIAIQLGYLDITQDDLLTAGEMEDLAANEVVIVATGSQGEPTSAMVRMSLGDHRQITLREGDTVDPQRHAHPRQRRAVQPHRG